MAISRDPLDESVHDFEANFLVRFLPALEPQFDPHLMIVTKELDGVVALDGQIVRVNHGGELNLLHSARGPRSAGILVPLRLFVKELAVIHDAANGGCGRGCDLDKVETFRLR